MRPFEREEVYRTSASAAAANSHLRNTRVKPQFGLDFGRVLRRWMIIVVSFGRPLYRRVMFGRFRGE